MSKEEDRLTARADLEQAVIDYYNACLKCGYDFKGDLKDVVWYATDGSVDIGE